MPEFLSYWYYHIPNYLLGALMYTCFGVFLLDIFFRPQSPNPIYRTFHRVVDPYYRFLSPVTPGFLPPFLLSLYAAFWSIILRVVLYMTFYYFGLLPHFS